MVPPPRRASDTPTNSPRLVYIGALDGLRALAVIAVVLYHAELIWSPVRFSGGFLGVDMFFVLSGFLITSLLLVEWQGARKTDLGAFWLRRARRLLPAVFLLLLVVLGYAIVFLPEEVASLRADALAAVFYVTNWHLIIEDVSYFESWGRPSLFRHLWSLAIEEQFYILWPLIFVAGIRLLRPVGFGALLVLAALASAAAMALLYEPGADPSRVYYGTGTRSTGLLVGSALALLWTSEGARRVVSARLGDVIGVAALVAVGAMTVFVTDTSDFLYRGGFLVASIATAVLIASIANPESRLGALLSWAPLRWVGERSYSIYLWHWPVLMLTRPGIDVSFDGPGLLAMQVAIIVALSELSYRFVETPVRHGALGRAWDGLRTSEWRLGPRVAAYGGAAAVVAVCVTVGVFAWQSVEAEQATFVSASGARLNFEDLRPVAVPPVSSEASPSPDAPSDISAALEPAGLGCNNCAPPTVAAQPTAPPPPPPPTATATWPPAVLTRITAIGDSVMLGAGPQLYGALPDLAIYAEVALQASRGLELVRQLKADQVLGQIVVVHLGNNGEITDAHLAALLDELADRERVVLVNVKVSRPWQDPNNAKLAGLLGRYPNVVLADWRAVSNDHPEFFWNDGVHLRPAGASAYASLVSAHALG